MAIQTTERSVLGRCSVCRWAALAVLAAAQIACAVDPASAPKGRPYAAPANEKTAMRDERSIPGRAAQAAVEDLARRLAIDASRIEVVRAQEVEWPDGSLGCPQPGMAYRQVLVNGSFVQLRVGERLYNYHGAGDRPPSLCTSREEVTPEQLPGAARRGDR